MSVEFDFLIESLVYSKFTFKQYNRLCVSIRLSALQPQSNGYDDWKQTWLTPRTHF